MSQRRWLPSLALVLTVALLPQPSQAQLGSFNFCTVFEDTPQTENVRSALFEEWDGNESAWDSNERWILSYQNGNPTELLFQERDQGGAWADTARAEGTYDAADNITQCTFQFRDAGTFVNAFRSNFSYDSNGRLADEITQQWDTTDASPNGTWVNSLRITNSYDADGNLGERLTENWDPDDETWNDAQRVQNTYDNSDRLTERVQEQSDGSGGWIKQQRTQNTYGSNGLSETVDQTWDLFTQTWENETRSQFSYPDDDTEVEVAQSWDGSSWVNEERTTRELNGDGFAVDEVTEVWTGSAWVNGHRTQNTFTTINGTPKFEQALDQTWASGSDTWENASRTTLSYTDVIPVELTTFDVRKDDKKAVLRWKTESETNNAGFELQHRPADDDSWQEQAFIESAAAGGTTSDPQSYRFRTASLSVGTHYFRLRQVDLDGTATLTDSISVRFTTEAPFRLTSPSPNPVSDKTSVSFAVDDDHRRVEVSLYNVLGQRVRTLQQGEVSPNEEHTVELDAQRLPSGRYVLRFKAGDRAKTRTVTVVR